MSFKTKLIGAIQYFTLRGSNLMEPYQYEHMKCLERRLQIQQKVLSEILVEIEKNCREYSEIHYVDYGFDSISVNNFEDSLQSKIIKQLEDLEYKCIMSFNPTYLTIKGW